MTDSARPRDALLVDLHWLDLIDPGDRTGGRAAATLQMAVPRSLGDDTAHVHPRGA